MSRYRLGDAPFAAAHAALLVIDMQTGFVDPSGPAFVPGASALIGRINALAAAMRAAGGLVVFTRHTVDETGDRALPAWVRAGMSGRTAERFTPGGDAHPLHSGMMTSPGDLVIDKYRYSALATRSSGLDAELRRRGIDTILITGVMTNVCCESTARDGHSLDYRVLLVTDANAALSEEAHRHSLLGLGQYFACLLDAAAAFALISANPKLTDPSFG